MGQADPLIGSASAGAPYANHCISVLTIVGRKITSGRDYLDPIAVSDATGWPDEH